MSILLSTLLQIKDQEILACAEYQILLETIAATTVYIITVRKVELNLHTLFMLTSFFTKHPLLSWHRKPTLWALISTQLAENLDTYRESISQESVGALSELIMFYIGASNHPISDGLTEAKACRSLIMIADSCYGDPEKYVRDSSLVIELLFSAEIDQDVLQAAQKHLQRIVSQEEAWTDIDKYYLKMTIHRLLSQGSSAKVG